MLCCLRQLEDGLVSRRGTGDRLAADPQIALDSRDPGIDRGPASQIETGLVGPASVGHERDVGQAAREVRLWPVAVVILAVATVANIMVAVPQP